MKILVGLFFALALTLACNDTSTTRGAVTTVPHPGATGTSGAEQHSLVGLWQGPLGEEEGATEAARVMLQFPTETRFRLTALFMPIEGEVVRSGHDITLKPKSHLGFTFEELRNQHGEQAASSYDQAEKLIKGTLSENGATITLEHMDETTVFTRKIIEPLEPVVEKVTPSEKRFVGTWMSRTEVVRLESFSSEQKIQMTMTEASLRDALLILRPDNTFYMWMSIEYEGTWRQAGSELVLNFSKVMGMTPDVTGAGPARLSISSDGRTLTSDFGPGGPVGERLKVYFERAQ